ncbi:unnamed protein product [Aphanomyces euteiches]
MNVEAVSVFVPLTVQLVKCIALTVPFSEAGLYLDLAVLLSEFHAQSFFHEEERALALLRALHADETTQFLARYITCRPSSLTHELVDASAQLGYTKAVEFLCGLGLPHSDFAIAGAANQGHVDVVAIFYHHGQPTRQSIQIALNHAAHAGQFRVVQFLYENRLKALTIVPILYAANGGHKEVERFLRERYEATLLE